MSLKLRTLGHASLALYRDGEAPLLLTDPWLVGSVYWRSWWLESYPTAAELDWLARSAVVYVTHEHPDHYHMPSLRRLGEGPLYLFPRLAELGFVQHAADHGFRTAVMAPGVWRPLGSDAAILSIPCWNDDSLLLVDTPRALIVNLNDAKPAAAVLRAIRRLIDALAKPVVLACSYSPASLVNSFLDEHGTVSIKSRDRYVRYICGVCDALGASVYLPFASQAVFLREDSRWANEHRTTLADLERHWHSPTKLLPPYATLDLDDLSHEALPPERYHRPDETRVRALTARRLAEEGAAVFGEADVAQLRRKLNAFRLILAVLFPRGFSFRFGARCLRYDGWRGRLRDVDADGPQRGDFVIAVPTLTMKEALANDHVSDLGITMFVRIRLLRRFDPRWVYGLFVLFGFDDYRHTRTLGALWRWVRAGIAHTFRLRLPLPDAEPRGTAPRPSSRRRASQAP